MTNNSSFFLRKAVTKVIEQNKSVGTSPNKFIIMTENGDAEDIVSICEKFLSVKKHFDSILYEIYANKAMITLEEVIAYDPHPEKFGLSQIALESAKERAKYLGEIRQCPNLN